MTTIHDRVSSELRDTLSGSSAWLAIAVILTILSALYWAIAVGLVADWWSDPNYSHGFLVPIFSGVLIWRKRARLATVTADGSWRGLPLLLGGIGALVLGNVAGEDFLMRSSLVIVLAGLVMFHFGPRAFRLMTFPLAFLMLMIPLPQIVFNAITLPLQTLAASSAASVLDLLGVPVLLDGHVIHLSQISLGVTEACSGIRSLISLMALTVAWAYLTLRGTWQPVVFVLAAVPVTVIANAGRVIVTGVIGQSFGAEYTEGFFHSLTGWLIFMIGFLGLLAVHVVIRRFHHGRVP